MARVALLDGDLALRAMTGLIKIMHDEIEKAKAERGWTWFDPDMSARMGIPEGKGNISMINDGLKKYKCENCVKVQVGTDESIISCCKEPRIVDEQGNAVVAWSVPVIKKKSRKSMNSNQRRAAARRAKPNGNFTGVLEEENSMAICSADEEWMKLELTVDSGAAETICPGSDAPNVPTVPGQKMAQGVRYTCAGGKKIPNLGEKRCLMCTNESSTEHRLTMQVADVNRALLSVSKAVDGGNRVVFDSEWSYIEDKRTGEKTTVRRRGGLYVLETWVKARSNDPRPIDSPFGGQGGKR